MKSLSKLSLFIIILTIGFLCLYPVKLTAQNHSTAQNNQAEHGYFNPWIARISGGTGIFLGDIKQNPLLPSGTGKSEWRFGGSLSVEYRFNPVLSLRGQSLYTGLAGTKTSANRYFNADLIEGTLGVGFYPVNIFSTSNSRFAEFYLIAGFGVTNFNSKLYELSNENLVSSSGGGSGIGIGGMTLEPILTAGFGVDFPLTGNWMISFETTNKLLTNDLLDLTDSNFPYDVYNFTSLGLAYRFGMKSAGKVTGIKVKETTAEDIYISTLPVNPETQPTVKEEVKTEELPLLNTVITIKENEPAKTVEEITTISTPLIETLQPAVNDINKLKSTGYRVQILACSKKINLETLSKKTGIAADLISESIYNGLFIYTTGSYENYEQVVVARKTIRNKPATADAFVVYFEEGQRQKTLPIKPKQN